MLIYLLTAAWLFVSFTELLGNDGVEMTEVMEFGNDESGTG